jgi:hypothetical protein
MATTKEFHALMYGIKRATMNLQVKDYIGKLRDTKHERELRLLLGKQPEEERFQFIQELLSYDLLVGLKLAQTCLQKEQFFERILEQGLQTADASTLKFWLECVVPRLGMRRVIALLTQKLETDVVAVTKALYWLPRLLPKDDKHGGLALTKLTELTCSKEGKSSDP